MIENTDRRSFTSVERDSTVARVLEMQVPVAAAAAAHFQLKRLLDGQTASISERCWQRWPADGRR